MPAPRRPLLTLGLSVAALALLTVPALAQEEAASLPPGPIYVSPDGLTVAEGETLRIGPDTTFTGPGRIQVAGTLIVKGAPGAPAEFNVPIVVVGNGSASFEQARLWGINTTALEALAGSVTMRDSLVEGNARGMRVAGESRLVVQESVLRDHTGEAVYVDGSTNVTLANVTASGNGRGLTVYSARSLLVEHSQFLANDQHVVIDLGPWTAGEADIMLRETRFAAPTPTPARLPSILLRHDTPLADAQPDRIVRMESNRIEGASIGLRAEGQGLVLHSFNDTYVENDVGVSVQLATVRLEAATLDNARDVEGAGRVQLENVHYLGDANIDLAPLPGSAPTWPWLFAAGAVVMLGGGLAIVLAARARRPAPLRVAIAPPPEPASMQEQPPQPKPDLSVPVTPIERRILEDILRHPGTAQRAIADRLGYTRQALHYHVKKLEARGLVLKTLEGRETHCTVPPAVASMFAPPPVTQDVNRTGSEEKR